MKAILFDLDGTIGNTLPLCIAAFREAIEPLAARRLTDQEIIATFGPSEEGTIAALLPDKQAEGSAGDTCASHRRREVLRPVFLLDGRCLLTRRRRAGVGTRGS